MDTIKLLIADDEMLIREGLGIILSSDPEIQVVAKCKDGAEAAEAVKTSEVDVALMDIRMPKCDGVIGTKLIKENSPKTKILILTTFNDDEYIIDALKFGASGYLLKDTSHDLIINGIKSVYKGNMVINPDAASKIINSLGNPSSKQFESTKEKFNLTDREIDIIRCIGEGLNNKEIGEKLFLTEGTIKNHITEILSKLSLRDRTQIAIFAFKNNIMT